MKTCPSCKKVLKDEAKFCGGCGYKFPVAAPAAKAPASSGATCPQCGNQLKPGAKFCGKCGAKLDAAPATPPPVERRKEGNGFIRWSLIPGQIAVKITEEEVAACGKIKGFAIQEGTKALVFVDGRIAAELAAGSYKLSDFVPEEKPAPAPARPARRPAEDSAPPPPPPPPPPRESSGGFLGLFRRIDRAVSNVAERVGRFFTGKPPARPPRESAPAAGRGPAPERSAPREPEAQRPVVSLVLVRVTDFPLVFTVNEATTAGFLSDVGIHLLCKVMNVNEFYGRLLVDRQFVSFVELRQMLDNVVRANVNPVVASATPENVGKDPALAAALHDRLQDAISSVCPFLSVGRLVAVTAENQALSNLRKLSEELYVSEQELCQLQKRNDFLNRLQAVKNEQELAETRAANGQQIDMGRLSADLEEKKLEIYKQMALTKEEQAKFDLMLDAERKLREARNEEQLAVAMQEYEKSGMLRERELEHLRHQGELADLRDQQEYDRLEHQGRMAELRDDQEYDGAVRQGRMAELRDDQEYEMEKLNGDLARTRVSDAYSDERRDKDVAFTDERRVKDAAFQDERREKDAAFEDSRRRSEIELDREEQLNQMEMLRQAQAIRLERENDEHRRQLEADNAERAHEQAMQQAQLDAKLENQRIYAGMSVEQIMAANPDISPEAAQALAQKFNADGKEELLKAREADMARQSAQQMEMMRMMQQMAMAGMGANLQHQQEMAAQRQAELDRVRADAVQGQDRLLSGVQSAVAAAGAAFSGGAQPAARPAPPPPPAAPKCPHCGAAVEPGSSFCDECGGAV